tara:strand:- start:78 stop:764 length:687 start_codon:yes stop_codon:yes gene_type:complete
MKAVILAGGKGTRLRPYTTNFPKPLMPIDNKPILEIVINQLKNCGITDITITVGHLAELIMAYFGDGRDFGVSINYSKEKKALGTAGPLSLIKETIDSNFLLMNGDVLTDINFKDFIEYHEKNKNIATIGVSQRKVNIDFGVVEIGKDLNIKEWNEKPVIDYFVSMGIYALNPEIIELLPNDQIFNLPDLIIKAKDQGHLISSYNHKGYWLDIGREEDYIEACENFKL